MRLCGRAKPGEWTGEAGERFDDERYFMGALSHFAVFGAALRDDQVAQLRREYVRAFGLDVDRASAGPGDPTAVAFAVVSSLALAALLVAGLVGERLAQDHGVACARRRPRHQPDELLPGRFRGRVVAACDLAGQRLRRSHPDAGVAQTNSYATNSHASLCALRREPSTSCTMTHMRIPTAVGTLSLSRDATRAPPAGGRR